MITVQKDSDSIRMTALGFSAFQCEETDGRMSEVFFQISRETTDLQKLRDALDTMKICLRMANSCFVKPGTSAKSVLPSRRVEHVFTNEGDYFIRGALPFSEEEMHTMGLLPETTVPARADHLCA